MREQQNSVQIKYHLISNRSGLTLVELFVVLACLGILVGMMLPAMRSVREPARRTTCMNNIRQIALAAHNYQSAHQQFPPALGGLTIGESAPTHEGANQLSGLVLLLPFLEQVSLWEQISNPSSFNRINFPAGPAPWESAYPPWQKEIPGFRCPTSATFSSGFGKTNYAFCIGDQARGIHNPGQPRGAFGCEVGTTFDDITDGSSNTIGLAEMAISADRSVRSNFVINQAGSILDRPSEVLKFGGKGNDRKFPENEKLGLPGRGGRWADGRAGSGLVNTILPPNSPSAAVGGAHGRDGIYSASSFHPGVVIVALMDGSGHSVSTEVDCGDSQAATLTVEEMEANAPSPFGIWGAWGTARGGEISDISDL